MNTNEIKNLKAAYNAVFNQDGQIKACGRDACIELISLMKNHTSENIGDENTGTIEVETMQTEYHKLVS